VTLASQYSCGIFCEAPTERRTSLVDEQLPVDGQLRAVVAVHVECVVGVHGSRDRYVACTAACRHQLSGQGRDSSVTGRHCAI